MENNRKICGCWFSGVAIGFPAFYKEQKYITGEYITQNTLQTKTHTLREYMNSELTVSLIPRLHDTKNICRAKYKDIKTERICNSSFTH